MQKVMRMLALAAIGLALGGCAPVLVGMLMYDHTRSREDKRQFTEDFSRKNLEREKAGLEPLD